MGRVSPAGLIGVACLAALAAHGCAPSGSSVSGDDGEILAAVAVSLSPVVRELATAYESDHPGLALRLNTGASGVLLQQIRRGAPVDLFLSASPDEMDRLAAEGRIDRGRVVALASNRLVLVTPRDGAPEGDLRRGLERSSRIALGNPRTAPLGRYTQQALTALGVWETVRTRAIMAENARQVVEYVARGEVEAGIVYLSDARAAEGRVRRGPLLDSSTHDPIAYHGAVLNDAPHPDAAADFLRFLQTAAAAEALIRHGFQRPPGAP